MFTECLQNEEPGPKKGVFRVQPDDYGWQQDEYKLQNGQMDTLFVI